MSAPRTEATMIARQSSQSSRLVQGEPGIGNTHRILVLFPMWPTTGTTDGPAENEADNRRP